MIASSNSGLILRSTEGASRRMAERYGLAAVFETLAPQAPQDEVGENCTVLGCAQTVDSTLFFRGISFCQNGACQPENGSSRFVVRASH
jgi:hypothetical protein